MSMILDLITIALIVLCALIHYYRGFFRSVISFLGSVLAIILGTLFAPTVGGYIEPYIAGYFGEGAIGTTSLTSFLSKLVADPAPIANALGFTATVAAVMLLTLIVQIIVRIALKAPVLRTMDRFLGGVIGLIVGLALAWAFSLFVFNYSEVIVRMSDSIDAGMFEGSVVAKWFFEHNLFGYVMNLT